MYDGKKITSYSLEPKAYTYRSKSLQNFFPRSVRPIVSWESISKYSLSFLYLSMNLSICCLLVTAGKLDCHISVTLHRCDPPFLSKFFCLLQSSSTSLSRIIPSSFSGSSMLIGISPDINYIIVSLITVNLKVLTPHKTGNT
jgi:hypothetical protein